jgi:hypothetical protein
MGGQRYPTQKEIRELRQAADLPAPETARVDRGEITITLPSHGLAVIELK